jgi:curli biogenesis system outer membrane secretion channel CsgG
MKRASFLALCLGLALATISTSAQAPNSSGTARKKRIAVFDFDYATVHQYSYAIFGRDIDVGRGISDLLVTMLVKDGTYSVIERKNLDKILGEQNFSNSDRANPASAAKIGKLLGVDAIIVGSVTQFGNDTKNTGVGGVGAGLGKVGLGGFSRKESKAIVGIDSRIVDIDTAEILAVAEGKGESKRTSTSMTGGGGGWGGFGAGGVNFGASDFQNTIIGEATKAATEMLSTNLIAGNSKLVVRSVVVEGLVAAADGGQIIINVGAKSGLKVGDQMNVERLSREIKDPATGKVIRRMTAPVGVIKITDVDDQSAVGSVVSGTGFKVGDSVKTLTQ